MKKQLDKYPTTELQRLMAYSRIRNPHHQMRLTDEDRWCIHRAISHRLSDDEIKPSKNQKWEDKRYAEIDTKLQLITLEARGWERPYESYD